MTPEGWESVSVKMGEPIYYPRGLSQPDLILVDAFHGYGVLLVRQNKGADVGEGVCAAHQMRKLRRLTTRKTTPSPSE